MSNNNLTNERLSALIRVARDSLELYEMELPVIDDVMLALAELQQCRAAMLQGAEPVTTANKLPEGWVACSERMPEGMTDVHISNGHDVGQGWWDGDTWQTQHDYYSVPGDVTHWMPLPAAPQQRG